MSEHKFKAGDYAIYMGIRSGICIVHILKRFDGDSTYPYLVNYNNTGDGDDRASYTETGHYVEGDTHPLLLPCTQENIDAVNKLYGTNLCMPKTIVDKLRDYFKANGDRATPVLCKVWDDDYDALHDAVILAVCGQSQDAKRFRSNTGTYWDNAEPYSGDILTAKDFE